MITCIKFLHHAFFTLLVIVIFTWFRVTEKLLSSEKWKEKSYMNVARKKCKKGNVGKCKKAVQGNPGQNPNVSLHRDFLNNGY